MKLILSLAIAALLPGILATPVETNMMARENTGTMVAAGNNDGPDKKGAYDYAAHWGDDPGKRSGANSAKWSYVPKRGVPNRFTPGPSESS